MDTLQVPSVLHEKLGGQASEDLVTMFADAHTLAAAASDRRIDDAVKRLELSIDRRLEQSRKALEESVDRRLEQSRRALEESVDRRLEQSAKALDHRLDAEVSKMRLAISDLLFDLLKWSFLFWVTQLAALTGLMSVMLRVVMR